ncbi:MAG TPA: efflux RND transporter periplasmic adaptor subunit [Thermoanaerobaculia bacterium]|nr:efflux RND transporter periplasmic adaptor subunit [Thermoanaerobaculia bacterium]
MRRWLLRIGVLLALVAIVVALRQTVFKPKPIEVQVVEAARGQVEETVTNSRAGTVKALRRAQISPEVGGRAVEIPHREGEHVGKGDVLLRLDPAVLDARQTLSRRELQAAQAERDQACANAERSRRELARLTNLAKEGIISTDVLDQTQTAAATTRAACEAARAGVAQAQAGIDLQGRQIGQTIIRAPFSGIVADVSIEVGEFTTPSPPGMPIPPVIDLIDPESVYVSAPMDEVDSARIRPGQPVRISVDSYPGRSFPGRVLRIAPYVLDREEQNRTIEIEAGFAEIPAGVRLLPGTSADVEVILETRENVLRVSTPALLEGNRVLVVENGLLVEKKLAIGLKNWDWTEVRTGLAPGALVVTSLDRPEVKAGAQVRVARSAAGEEDAAP